MARLRPQPAQRVTSEQERGKGGAEHPLDDRLLIAYSARVLGRALLPQPPSVWGDPQARGAQRGRNLARSNAPRRPSRSMRAHTSLAMYSGLYIGAYT